MRCFVRVFLSCLLAVIIAVTSSTPYAFASKLGILNAYGSSANTEVAFVSSEAIKTTGKVILRVAPKVANKLVKKYGARIVKVIPAAGTVITVIEIGADVYDLVQEELDHMDNQ